MQFYWLVALVWVVLLGFGCSSKGNVDKYISKTYFDKHGTLLDAEFEDFVANEIPCGSCQMLQDNPNFVPQVLDLDRRLIGEGSHRRLSSFVRFGFSSVQAPQLQECSWEAVIIERLPLGVFADPFELQHLVQRGVFHDAAVFGDTNLELPSFKSNRSLVEIHRKIDYGDKPQDKDELDIHVSLPLHARYQPLGHGFSRVEFGLPDLFICCHDETNAHNEICLVPTTYNREAIAVDIVWEIPSGIKEHEGVVSAVTFFSAIMSALLIVSISIYHSRKAVDNHAKRS